MRNTTKAQIKATETLNYLLHLAKTHGLPAATWTISAHDEKPKLLGQLTTYTDTEAEHIDNTTARAQIRTWADRLNTSTITTPYPGIPGHGATHLTTTINHTEIQLLAALDDLSR